MFDRIALPVPPARIHGHRYNDEPAPDKKCGAGDRACPSWPATPAQTRISGISSVVARALPWAGDAFHNGMADGLRAGGDIDATEPRLDLMRSIGTARGRARQRFGRAALGTLLALCIYVAQVGAFVHGITHLRGPALATGASQSCVLVQGDDAGVEDFCLQCLAYAQVTSAASSQPFVAPIANRHSAVFQRYREPIRRAANIVFLARGPPPAI